MTSAKDQFFKAWESTEIAQEIRDAFGQDQVDLESREVFKAPDGLYFEISRKLPCGTVVTENGLWLTPEEFSECERVK